MEFGMEEVEMEEVNGLNETDVRKRSWYWISDMTIHLLLKPPKLLTDALKLQPLKT